MNRDDQHLARNMYTPYGEKEVLSADTTWAEYAGMRHHEPSGLYLTYYRAYDPKLGRWLSRDPIGEAGGINLYGYVGCSPGSDIDPYGLFGMDDIWGAIYDVTGEWAPSSGTVNVVTGFGDGAFRAITLGIGDLSEIRTIMGIAGCIDRNSVGYRYSSYAGTAVGSFALFTASGKMVNKLTDGYGITFGSVSAFYSLPKIKGMAWLNVMTPRGRFAIQTGNWGKANQPFYKQLYLKIPGRTNHHWPWN